MHELVEQFLDNLVSERRLSLHTQQSYARDLQAVENFVNARGMVAWENIDDELLRAWVAHQYQAGLSGHSIGRALSALRTFYRYLHRLGRVAINPALGVKAPKSARRLPQVLDVDAMQSLFQAPLKNDLLAVRDRAIVELLYSSGLRLAELVALNVESLESEVHLVRVMGKGKKERLLPIGRCAREALLLWLKQRAPYVHVPGNTALFVTARGKRLGARAIQKRIRLYGLQAGSTVPLHPHIFRHCFASHLLESSGDLRSVQELLGHADIATTQIYTHLDFQYLATVYDKAHPRAKRQKEKK